MTNKQKLMMTLMLSAGVANAAYVPIGNVGNADDSTGYGGVDYEYSISDHEVTIAEFQASGAGDGDEGYWNDGTRTVGTAAPASNVSLYEAMKYCNYLTSGDVNVGAYVFSGGTYQSTDRATALTAHGTIYALPTEDEWYKAAYYTGSGYSPYANGTGSIPVEGGGATGWNYNGVNSSPNYTRDTALGTTEQNGTVNMMGNVWEWMEDPSGIGRGGGYNHTYGLISSNKSLGDPSSEDGLVGFRTVEVIPEPATLSMVALMGGGVLFIRRFFMI